VNLPERARVFVGSGGRALINQWDFTVSGLLQRSYYETRRVARCSLKHVRHMGC